VPGQTTEYNYQLSGYYLGASTTIACQHDQRFSFCTYAPRSILKDGPEGYRLLVAVHSSDRDYQDIRMQFADLAEKEKLIVLAPLFPSGIADRQDNDNYKYIAYRDIRFDLLLLQMIEEAATLYGINVDRFALFGFSGGAHFAHRFFYLHPDRLSAVSIAAPGSVTILDQGQDWWVGTRNMEDLFGKSLDLAAMRQVPAQLLVGREDTNTDAITHRPGRGKWMPGANDAGVTRIDRLHTLYKNWQAQDLAVSLEEIPGAGHDCRPLVAPAVRFFAEHMRGENGQPLVAGKHP